MGQYVQGNLLADEKIIYETHVSWVVYIPAVTMAIFFAALAFFTDNLLMWGIAVVVSALGFLVAWIKRFSTEIAVTDKRLILKTGFIQRETVEQFLEKIDSISVDQSIADRMVNAGTIIVRGSGQTFSPVQYIDDPLTFRKQINQQVDFVRKKLMQPFTVLRAVAAPLPLVNVDTDMIIPKQFLKTITRTGLGKCLFNDMRFDAQGVERGDFVLNRAPFRDAKILLAGANFGCGSSREHAPWALLDFGISCVIAPSFADIFFGNCFKNGILPVILPQAQCDELTRQADGAAMIVDLERQIVTAPDGTEFPFTVDAFRRDCLLKGLDDIGITLQQENAITDFEARQRAQQPWLWQGASS